MEVKTGASTNSYNRARALCAETPYSMRKVEEHRDYPNGCIEILYGDGSLRMRVRNWDDASRFLERWINGELSYMKKRSRSKR